MATLSSHHIVLGARVPISQLWDAITALSKLDPDTNVVKRGRQGFDSIVALLSQTIEIKICRSCGGHIETKSIRGNGEYFMASMELCFGCKRLYERGGDQALKRASRKRVALWT